MLLSLLLSLQAAEPTIVVTGTAKTDSQIRQEARGFIGAVAAAPGASDQLGRWNQPICTKVIGATTNEETLIHERIETVAIESGIRVSKRKSCVPNILVAFAADPSDVTRQVLARRSHAARSMPVSSRNDLIEGTYPVRWWYDLKVEGRYGEAPVGDNPALLNSLDTRAGGSAGGSFAQSEHQSGNISDYSSSLIGSKSRQSIGAATIVIDIARVRGQSKDALAAYVAMVALAPLKLPPRPVPNPTITNLFHATTDARPDDLSEWDRAYIAALYKTAANRRAGEQRGAMTAKIARSMRGED